MQNKLLKFLTFTSIFSLSISSFITSTYVKNTDIKFGGGDFNTLNYSNSTLTKTFSSSWNKLNYAYDDKIISNSELVQIRVYSNEEVKSNNNIANEKNHQSALWLGIINGGSKISSAYYQFTSAVDSIDELPTSSLGMEYEKLDSNKDVGTSGYINGDNLGRVSGIYSFSKNLPYNLNGPSFFRKNMAGVVVLKQAYRSGELDPWNLFSFTTSNSALSSKDLSSRYPQINDKNLSIWSDIEYKGNSAGWKSAQITFAIFDDKWWFTDKESSISISSKNIDKITIDEFKKLSIDEMLKYFDINLHNTPKYCVSNGSSSEESSTSVYFNDQDNRVEVKATTPRSYSPKFEKNSSYEIDKQWITDTNMTNTLYIPYNNFRKYNTSITTSTQQDGIKASGDIANYNPKQISDILGDGYDNSQIYNYLIQFIYDNRNIIFIDWPPQSTSNNPKDFFKFSTNDTYELVSITSSSIKFKFSAKGFYKDGEIINQWSNKKFELLITNLTPVALDVTHSLNVSNAKLYFPNATTVNSINDNEITSWVKNNKDKVVYNLPSTSSIVISTIKRNEDLGEIIIEFHVDKYFDNSGKEISKNLSLVSTIKGFDIGSKNSNWWIWLVIGISVLIVIIIIVLLIVLFLKKKKSNKVKKNKLDHKTTPKNNNQNNRLSASKNVTHSNVQGAKYKSLNYAQQKPNSWTKTSATYNSNPAVQGHNRFTPQNPNMGVSFQKPTQQFQQRYSNQNSSTNRRISTTPSNSRR